MLVASFEAPVRRTADSIVIKEANVQVIVDSSGVSVRIRGVPVSHDAMEVKAKAINAAVDKVVFFIDKATQEVVKYKFTLSSEKHGQIEVEGQSLSEVVEKLRGLGLVSSRDMALAQLALYVIGIEAIEENRELIEKELR